MSKVIFILKNLIFKNSSFLTNFLILGYLISLIITKKTRKKVEFENGNLITTKANRRLTSFCMGNVNFPNLMTDYKSNTSALSPFNIEVSNGSSRPLWPVAQHAKRLGRADTTQRNSSCWTKGNNLSAYCAAHLAFLNFTFHFLLFPFLCMSNTYNTPLNNYITSLRSKKVNQ